MSSIPSTNISAIKLSPFFEALHVFPHKHDEFWHLLCSFMNIDLGCVYLENGLNSACIQMMNAFHESHADILFGDESLIEPNFVHRPFGASEQEARVAAVKEMEYVLWDLWAAVYVGQYRLCFKRELSTNCCHDSFSWWHAALRVKFRHSSRDGCHWKQIYGFWQDWKPTTWIQPRQGCRIRGREWGGPRRKLASAQHWLPALWHSSGHDKGAEHVIKQVRCVVRKWTGS